ncbi:MAG TPA: chemotaxis protein CheW [Vicinamibacterales bacterium]|nr:chemotaxis protein CheW [Vicinamibacterales bacterium]
MTANPAPGESTTYILFTVAGTTYGAPSRQVRHVEMVDEVTPVPNAPPHVEGVVFSRGHVVPVVNLRVRFGFERGARDIRARLLVVEGAGRTVGLLADSAREFIPIPDAAIRAPGASLTGISGNYLAGVATVGERIILIVDLDDVIAASPLAAA